MTNQFELHRAYQAHLDSLPDFDSKLKFWAETVCKDELVLNLTYIDDDGKVLLKFGIEPANDVEKLKLNRFWLDSYRKKNAQQKWPVEAFSLGTNRPKKLAWIVQPYDNLVTDFERRMQSQIKGLLKSSLKSVKAQINLIAKPFDDRTHPIKKSIDELRKLLKENVDLDSLILESDIYKIYHLSLIWDIVHFEHYLRNRDLFVLSTNQPTKTKTENDKQEKLTKTFPKYLLHPKREQLAIALKNEFITEKGKGVHLMIKVLTDATPPLLSIENRKRKAIHEALTSFFDRDIGSYQSIFNFIYIAQKHSADLQSIEDRIQFILESIENNK